MYYIAKILLIILFILFIVSIIGFCTINNEKSQKILSDTAITLGIDILLLLLAMLLI